MEELKQDLETRAIEQQGALRTDRAEAEAQVARPDILFLY